jgi:hypothetical protein
VGYYANIELHEKKSACIEIRNLGDFTLFHIIVPQKTANCDSLVVTVPVGATANQPAIPSSCPDNPIHR